MSSRSLDILVAEDDANTRDFMSTLLAELGHHVTFCDDGLTAVKLVLEERRRFDMVLMDAQMPEVDGLEATRRIRQDATSRTLPIICVSARASGRTRDESIEAGCDRYIVKPCWDFELLSVMTELLRERGVLGPNEQV